MKNKLLKLIDGLAVIGSLWGLSTEMHNHDLGWTVFWIILTAINFYNFYET